jgi:2'-5' RNA ligase
MTSKRVFIALDISTEAREVCNMHIDRLRRAFPNVRVGWERPEKLHITLKFLGDTEPWELEKLISAMGEIAGRHASFRLKLSDTGRFPSRQRPRILWIGFIDNSDVLSELHADIEDVCRRQGFKEDGRRYWPHVTIGRIREPMRASVLCDAHLRTAIEPVEFEIAEIAIYESKLQSSGSVYSVLSTVNLRAP